MWSLLQLRNSVFEVHKQQLWKCKLMNDSVLTYSFTYKNYSSLQDLHGL
jgi:hypothetical protein